MLEPYRAQPVEEISTVVPLLPRLEVRGHLGGFYSAFQDDGALLLPCLIPQVALDECLERGCSAFYKERLNVVAPQAVQKGVDISVCLKTRVQGFLAHTAQDTTHGIPSAVATYIQTRMVQFEGAATYEYGLMGSAEMMHMDGGKLRGEAYGFPFVGRSTQAVNEAVGTGSPFQCDVGSAHQLAADEMRYEVETLLAQYSHSDLNARLAHDGNASSAHLGERVDTPHYHTMEPLAYNHFCTRRSAAIVSAGFESDIDGGIMQEGEVFCAYAAHSHYLGVRLSGLVVPAFANDAVGMDDDSTYHRVRMGGQFAVACQLKGTLHPYFVGIAFHVRWMVRASWKKIFCSVVKETGKELSYGQIP